MEPFTDLVLLIGTNPLPNFVVTEYFLKDNTYKNALKKIWLVHSELVTNLQDGTGDQAKNLETLLRKRHPTLKDSFEMIKLPDVSNATSIINAVNKKLFDDKSGLQRDCKIHLNYTGGTKVMGNHVYRAIERKVEGFPYQYFSYLDARNFQIVNDTGGVIVTNLRKEVKIEFQELIELHGFKIIETQKLDFSAAVNIFSQLINENCLDKYFDVKNGGYDRTFFEKKNRPGCLATGKNELDMEKLVKNFKPNEIVKNIINAMPAKYKLFDESGSFIGNNETFDDAIKFLDGRWLEDYVEGVLKEKFVQQFRQQKDSPIEILKNKEIRKPDWDKNTKFELDVILIKGYHLIGISCTTAPNKSLCKHKGFEIIHRTRQIGGDEARAVIVTRLKREEKNELKKELEIDTGGNSKNILVLGSEDIKKNTLFKEINDFMK
ncbi:MAG: hypothetical protein E3K32_03365 [wastewater metagenome]|nr:hypothetical protein [Candidatus Loosdrechtia aerotolerans]